MARLASMEAVGEAMLDAGYSVTGVRSALRDMAAVNGQRDTEVVVFPTASTRADGRHRSRTVSTMVAITRGILAGSAIGSRLAGRGTVVAV